MEARLEYVKEKVLVIGIDSMRKSFFNKYCCEEQNINRAMIKENVEIKEEFF